MNGLNKPEFVQQEDIVLLLWECELVLLQLLSNDEDELNVDEEVKF